MNKYEWLNKDSRKFLERGYLLEGETAEQRIRDIADTAEKYLKIKGFADKFEDYMSRGYYSLSSPIWSNFGRKRGLPISCFGSSFLGCVEDLRGSEFAHRLVCQNNLQQPICGCVPIWRQQSRFEQHFCSCLLCIQS